jgi:hypothetical protein
LVELQEFGGVGLMMMMMMMILGQEFLARWRWRRSFHVGS